MKMSQTEDKNYVEPVKNEVDGQGVATALFYIQDARQYVGNSVLWWGPDGGGYTTDIDKAGKYPADFRCRDTDVLWPVEEVDAVVQRHVDMQKLRRIPRPNLDEDGGAG